MVLTPGTYMNNGQINLNPQNTTATELFIHGGGATVSDTTGELLFAISAVSATIRDVSLDYPFGRALAIAGPTTLERVIVKSRVQVEAPTVARDLRVTTTVAEAIAVLAGGSLTLDRAVLQGGEHSLTAANNTTLTLSNVLAFGSSDTAFNIVGANGTIEFTTIGRAGASSTTGAGINCTVNLAVRSSIVWTSNSFRPAISGPCPLANVFAGPTAVAGAETTDPLFVQETANDYHLGAESPARDKVDDGPDRDFEGDARPSGVRFDIGADEATR